MLHRRRYPASRFGQIGSAVTWHEEKKRKLAKSPTKEERGGGWFWDQGILIGAWKTWFQGGELQGERC